MSCFTALPIRRALLSVSDKNGIVPLARSLADAGVELLSTGGTAIRLRDANLDVREVADITGFPEIMGGRVKTLHPKIHGGLLARGEEDEEVCQQHNIDTIDLLVVNLYPFEQTIARPDCSLAEAVENIDIGGPAMLRAAAKNYPHCCALVDPKDYPRMMKHVSAGEAVDAEWRFELAAKAFAHTAAYDVHVSSYLGQQLEPETRFGRHLNLVLERKSTLRYGENPHQQAAFYQFPGSPTGTLAAATLQQGQALSYNNLGDADAAWECVHEFTEPACVIVKHANPCGVAQAEDPNAAYEAAYQTDPVSAFGGIIAFNRSVSGTLAQKIINQQFVEVLIAPEFAPDALETLRAKPKLRVLEAGQLQHTDHCALVHSVSGGLLLQTVDQELVAEALHVVTERTPSDAEHQDLMFAWKVAKHVKSNAIVYARDTRTIGIGAGQMSRVYSARIAAIKAADEGLPLQGAAMASDAFFPFRDSIDAAHEVGITAVIQPGGSLRDEEAITAADEHDMAMVMTGMRHFRH